MYLYIELKCKWVHLFLQPVCCRYLMICTHWLYWWLSSHLWSDVLPNIACCKTAAHICPVTLLFLDSLIILFFLLTYFFESRSLLWQFSVCTCFLQAGCGVITGLWACTQPAAYRDTVHQSSTDADRLPRQWHSDWSIFSRIHRQTWHQTGAAHPCTPLLRFSDCFCTYNYRLNHSHIM